MTAKRTTAAGNTIAVIVNRDLMATPEGTPVKTQRIVALVCRMSASAARNRCSHRRRFLVKSKQLQARCTDANASACGAGRAEKAIPFTGLDLQVETGGHAG